MATFPICAGAGPWLLVEMLDLLRKIYAGRWHYRSVPNRLHETLTPFVFIFVDDLTRFEDIHREIALTTTLLSEIIFRSPLYTNITKVTFDEEAVQLSGKSAGEGLLCKSGGICPDGPNRPRNRRVST